MRIEDLHLHVGCSHGTQIEETLNQTRELLLLVRALTAQGEAMSEVLNTLIAEVAENRQVIQSAIVAFNGLSARIAELADDPAAIRQLAADLHAQTLDLANAVAANTPAEGEVPV